MRLCSDGFLRIFKRILLLETREERWSFGAELTSMRRSAPRPSNRPGYSRSSHTTLFQNPLNPAITRPIRRIRTERADPYPSIQLSYSATTYGSPIQPKTNRGQEGAPGPAPPAPASTGSVIINWDSGGSRFCKRRSPHLMASTPIAIWFAIHLNPEV